MPLEQTPEMRALRDLFAPLVLAEVLKIKEASRLSGVKYHTMRMWRNRERLRSDEDIIRRLLLSKSNFNHDELEERAIVNESIINVEVVQTGNNLDQQVPVPISTQDHNDFDSLKKQGLTHFIEELSQLQKRTVGKLVKEEKRLLKLERSIDQELKRDDLTTTDLKRLIETLDKCSEYRRKLAMLPWGVFDPNKQVSLAPQLNQFNFSLNGLQDYTPKKV